MPFSALTSLKSPHLKSENLSLFFSVNVVICEVDEKQHCYCHSGYIRKNLRKVNSNSLPLGSFR